MPLYFKLAAVILGPLAAASAAAQDPLSGIPTWAYILVAVLGSGVVFRLWLLRPEKDSVIARAAEQAVNATHGALTDVRVQLSDTLVLLGAAQEARAQLGARVDALTEENKQLREAAATSSAAMTAVQAQLDRLESKVGGRRENDPEPR